MNHTPTPWRYERTWEWGDCVRGGTRTNIGDGKQDEGYVAFRLNPNNAKYIVQACNNYDALIAACRQVVQAAQSDDPNDWIAAEAQCHDALAAAGESAELEPTKETL